MLAIHTKAMACPVLKSKLENLKFQIVQSAEMMKLVLTIPFQEASLPSLNGLFFFLEEKIENTIFV